MLYLLQRILEEELNVLGTSPSLWASISLSLGKKALLTLQKNPLYTTLGFPGGSVVKNTPTNGEDAGLIPESGGSPGEGNGHPLQYSCLGNPMDRGAWWPTSMGSQESDMT